MKKAFSSAVAAYRQYRAAKAKSRVLSSGAVRASLDRLGLRANTVLSASPVRPSGFIRQSDRLFARTARSKHERGFGSSATEARRLTHQQHRCETEDLPDQQFSFLFDLEPLHRR